MKPLHNCGFRSLNMFLLFVLIFAISGCGSLTKMRYSRGFKSNLEFNFQKKQGEPERRNIALKAKKHQQHKAIIPLKDTTIPQKTASVLSIAPVTREKKGTQILPKRHEIKNTIIQLKSLALDQRTVNEQKPIEPNIKTAITLFLIYFVIGVIAFFIILASFLGLMTIDPLLGLLLLYLWVIASLVLSILSFVLAIIGLIRLIRSKGEYRGAIGAILIILWYILPLILSLFSLF